MDNGGQENTANSNQNQSHLSITLAASSMINASDRIPPDAYQANLKRIQEVKEIVRRLETNNESAHKNFLMDELEKRVKEGREAEEMMARLKNAQALPDTIHFTNHLPSDKPDLVLPSTATLVEVTEPRPSSLYSPPAPTIASRPPQPPQMPQPQRPVQHVSRDYSTSQRPFIHYTPRPTTHQPSSAPLQRAPIDTPGWGNPTASGYSQGYATETVPYPSIAMQRAFNTATPSTGYQPTQSRQVESWNVYQSQVPQYQTTNAAYAPGYAIPPVVAQDRSAGPSKPGMYPQPTLSNHFPVYQAPLSAVQNQFQTLPSHTESFQTLQGAYGTQVSDQTATIQSRTKPTQFLQQPPPQSAASLRPPSAPSEPRQPPQRLTQQPPQPWPQQPPPPRHPAQQPAQSRQSPPRSFPAQQLPQIRSHQPLPPSLSAQQPPQSRSQQSIPQSLPDTQHPLSQFQQSHSASLPPPLQQPPQSQQHPFPDHLQPPASTAPSSTSPRIPQAPDAQPSQVRDSQHDAAPQSRHIKTTQPDRGQEERSQQTPKPMDLATYIRLFQVAFQRGPEIMKAFCNKSNGTGVSREWFEAAKRSIPQPEWEAFIERATQSGPSSKNVPSRSGALPSNASATLGTSVPVPNAQPPPTTQPAQPTLPTQHANTSFSIPNVITQSAPGQPVTPYAMAAAAQMKYYSDEATRAILAAQGTNIPRAGPQSAPLPQTATAERSVPQTQTSPKTPKGADRSTLARDILRSLGKPTPKLKETRGESSNGVRSQEPEGGRLSELTPSTMEPSGASPKPPTLVPTVIGSPSMTQENSVIPEAPQRVASPGSPAVSEAKPAPQEQPRPAAVIEGPIMIDLTLDDSDESVDGDGQKPSFPVQTVAAPPAFRTNTTTHTPLLESLSLEEAPVVVATTGKSADVRMQSPPLHLTVDEEDVESELLYPQPEDLGSTSSSSNLQPSGAIERPASSQLPLFLPSPPFSPTPSDHSPNTEPLELEMNVARDENRPSLKRRSVEDDGMEIDIDLASLLHVRKRRKQRAYVLVPPAPPPIKKLIRNVKERTMVEGIVSGSEDAEDDEELRYNRLERLLIEESKSRLLERRCRWSGCDAILNCGASLLAHLIQHTHEENLQAPFVCRWAGCKRQFNTSEECDIHLERHTIRPLPCPIAGCDEQFDKPIQAMQHEVQHQNEGHRQPLMRKPTYEPIVPSIPARLGQAPDRLPSHRVIPRRVVKSTISADRHAVMGPWVLWNIFSPVELNTRKQNAPMRGRPSRQVHISTYMDTRHDYDFLVPISSYSTKTPQLDDLDSTLVTLDAARGLTIWGPGPDLNSSARLEAPEEPTIGESAPQEEVAVTTSSAAETTMGGGNLDNHDAVLAREDSDVTQQDQFSGQPIATGEEEDVERMLVL